MQMMIRNVLIFNVYNKVFPSSQIFIKQRNKPHDESPTSLLPELASRPLFHYVRHAAGVPDALVQHVDVGHTLALPYYPIILVSSKIYKYILEYKLQHNPD